MSRQSEIGCSPSRINPNALTLVQFCAQPLAIARRAVPFAAIASLITMTIPSRPANAFTEFQICAAQLVRLAAVAPEEAAAACSDALHPKELSRCVVTIHQLTPTLTQDALVACTKVRRPVELSSCVSDISNKTRESQTSEVIDYCRRSLLPLRYSECVVGLSREVDFAPSRAMALCIKAEDFPRNLYPTVAPPPPQSPTPPAAVPNVLPQSSTSPADLPIIVPPPSTNPGKP